MSNELKKRTEGIQRRHVRPETGMLTLEQAKSIAFKHGWEVKDEDSQLIDQEDLFLISMMISDKTVDRHDDTIDPDGWELKNYNGVILWAHMHAIPTIGKALNTWKSGGQLRQVWKTVPKDVDDGFSHMIGKMYQHQYLTDSSVGFKILEYEIASDRKGEDSWFAPLDIKRAELLENSAVNVGAHPGAGVKAFDLAREAGIDTAPMALVASKLLDMTAGACGISRDDLEKMYFKNRDEEKSFHIPERKTEIPEIEKSGPSITEVNIAVIQAVEIKKAELELVKCQHL